MLRRPLLASLGALIATMVVLKAPAASACDKPVTPTPPPPAGPGGVPTPYPNAAAEADDHIAKGTTGVAALKAIALEPAPAKLTAAEKSAYTEYSAWVGTAADRISAAVTSLSTTREKYRAKPTALLLKEMASLNEQFLALQQTLLGENEKHAAVSKIMKTKHDTVKNSISNIR